MSDSTKNDHIGDGSGREVKKVTRSFTYLICYLSVSCCVFW